jgi:hypothetical protein
VRVSISNISRLPEPYPRRTSGLQTEHLQKPTPWPHPILFGLNDQLTHLRLPLRLKHGVFAWLTPHPHIIWEVQLDETGDPWGVDCPQVSLCNRFIPTDGHFDQDPGSVDPAHNDVVW